MKTIKNQILIFALLSFGVSLKTEAQEPSNIDTIVNTFFRIYEKESTDKAFDYIFSTNSLIDKNDVNKIKKQVSEYRNILGNYYGKGFLMEKQASHSIKVKVYVLNYEAQPLRFIFTFYKPNKTWKIQNFKISDNFIEEIEKTAIN